MNFPRNSDQTLPGPSSATRRLTAASPHRAAALALMVGTCLSPAMARAADTAEADSSDSIVVLGARKVDRIETGPLGNRSILETPFSVASVGKDEIARIAATTIDAALSYDASIRSNNSGVASGNTFSVRGQSIDLTNGYKFDGLPFPYWFQDQPIEALDQIQVLKGAAGFVYGYASPSGVVNFVSKKPTPSFTASANVSIRSSNIWRAHVDVGGPLTDGGSLAFRFNAVQEQGTLFNGAENRNQFASLWLQGDITSKLSWSLDGFYQRTWQANQSNSIALGANVTSLAPVSGAKFNLGSPSTTKFNDIAQITARLNYQISKDWKASLALRHSVLDERFPGNTATITSNRGDYTLGLLNQNRLFFYNVAQLSFNGSFSTGRLKHDLNGGLDYLDVNFDYDYQPYITSVGRPTTSTGTLAGTSSPYTWTPFTGNLYTTATPDWGSTTNARNFQRAPDWFPYQRIRQRGFFISDTLHLGRFELLAGLRYTRYKEANYEPVIKDTFFRENSLTPVVALSYDVAQGARIYGSRVEALQRGGIAPDTTVNAGQSFGPIKSIQYEAGIKVQRRGWGGTLATFRTDVPSEFTNPVTNTFVRDGERRYQGIEFEGSLNPDRQWSFNISVAYLDAVQTKAQNAAVVGKQVPGTTGFQIAGSVEYQPDYVPGLRLFAGVHHSGRAYGQATNTFIFAPVTLGDAGIAYTVPHLTREVKIQGNISNITDKWYWIPNSTGTGLSAGAPRTFSLSIGVSTQKTASATSALDPAQPLLGEGWYLGLAAGGFTPQTGRYNIRSIVNPATDSVANGIQVAQDTGWELAATLGHDFGLIRGELEVADKETKLSRVVFNDARIPIDSSSRGPGVYAHPGGRTRILSIFGNALLDIGGTPSQPWSLQLGGGVGLARVNSDKWRLEDNVDISFQRDNRTALAFQGIAAISRRISRHVEATLKYRYFVIPDLTLQSARNSALEGKWESHSVLVGASWHL